MLPDEQNDPLRRLQILQRDLIAFTESRIPAIDRLSEQLDACTQDLKRLLERNKKNEKSRQQLSPNNSSGPSTITIDNVEYRITEEFRQSAQHVADELDLDEIEAAGLCIRSQLLNDGENIPKVLFMRAVLRFHEQRQALLDCLRIILYMGFDSNFDNDEAQGAFREVAAGLISPGASETQVNEESAYWRKCMEGMSDIEMYLKKVSDYRDKLVVTGQGMYGDDGDFMVAQRLLLTRQHESLASILTYLVRASYVQPEDFGPFLRKAAGLEAEFDITIHYLPILISGAGHFNSESSRITPDKARDLYRHFAVGPQQLTWKQSNLKAAATVCWLAEYAARFPQDAISLGHSDTVRSSEEDARSKLFFDALKDKGFHLMLAAAASLRPVVWHDPARTSIIDFLVDFAVVMPSAAPRPTDEFSTMTMQELQAFSDAFVTNMPDTLRMLKTEEDERRRNILSQSTQIGPQTELDLERFMVIMACAYQDDAEAARDFWDDEGSNLCGFLKWVSNRLPTPRIAAFCQLLRCLASNDRSANQAHRFLLDDTASTTGKLRNKAYRVSWAQIFSELELYSSSMKDRPAAPENTPGQDRANGEMILEEPETHIMLDAYLGLAAHICRTSPVARHWLLKEQDFHIGEVMFQLARSSVSARIRACCLDLLAALLTDQLLEVRNGVWVLLDSWISSGGLNGSVPRVAGRPLPPAKQYLSVYVNNAEAGTSMVGLLNALIAPTTNQSELSLDSLPFPENLGAPHRHAGINTYVDFVMDAVFARKVSRMPLEGELSMINLIRYQCLHFAFQCLSSFNEDLVLLANTTDVSVESAMETKSLATYARLHPFARVMEWLFDRGVLVTLFATLQQNLDALNDADGQSPLVQATLKSIQVLSLAWKLQPTYFDLVRPAILAQTTKPTPVSTTWTSIDEVFLAHLEATLDVALFTACKHVDVSLECLALLQKLGSSRKLAESAETDVRGRHGSRMIGVILPMSEALTLQLAQDFYLDPWDLETVEAPLKAIKAKAVLDLLNVSLDATPGKPSIAHCLLGFHCRERSVEVLPQSAFAHHQSLFNAIAQCAVHQPVINKSSHTSWLLSLKKGCLEVILKLASSPTTSRIVQPELRSMDFLAALSQNQISVGDSPLWDGLFLSDQNILLDSSAVAVRDFMHVRAEYFRIAAMDLRVAAEHGAFSVQEKIVSAMLGTIKLATGEQTPTVSILELFDFFDLETREPFVPRTTFFGDADVSNCTKNDEETGTAFDIALAKELLILRKKELKDKGQISEPSQLEAADNEIVAILAALTSQNNFAAIQNARLDALEAWTELLSLVITKGALEQDDVIALSLQGLLVALPKYEKSLAHDLEAAKFLAKLTLTFTHTISPASNAPASQTADVAIEQLLSTFRVCLRAVTDSSTDLALRDVAYRTGCAVLAFLPKVPKGGKTTPAASARQLLHLVQNSGERLLGVLTEDAFSGRGVTRVSSLLFLDGLVSLFQSLKVTSAFLRALTKLNFVPVLIETSIGNIAWAFKGGEEMVASLAYFHTALALLLRFCQTTDGTQLVLNSGLFSAIDDSKLFTTDPDIGLDIENDKALKEFHAILANVLRLITTAVMQKGPQPGKAFLQQNRFTVQAIFKQASRGQALEVAEEFSRLILATGFLEDDDAKTGREMTNGFT